MKGEDACDWQLEYFRHPAVTLRTPSSQPRLANMNDLEHKISNIAEFEMEGEGNEDHKYATLGNF